MFLLSNCKYLPVNETDMDKFSQILLMLLLLLLKLAISGDVKRVQDNFNNKSIQTTSASLLRHIWKLQSIIFVETSIPLNLTSPKAANYSSALGKKSYVTFTGTDDSSTRKTVPNYAKRKDKTQHAVEDTHVTNNIGLIPVWRYTINREKRDIPDYCYKFQVGDEIKQEFYSPGYPGHYGPNLNCHRVLEAEPGMVIKLDFRDVFNLEDQEDCAYDYLEVRDGQYGFSRLLGKFCKSFPPEIVSSSRFLWLHFHSDESIEGEGFRAVWRTVPRNETVKLAIITPETGTCLIHVSGKESLINTTEITEHKKMSEQHKLPLDCMWIITVEEGWKIQVTFPSFKLEKPNECETNFVQIYDNNTDMPSQMNNFCGSIADLVLTKSSRAYLRFYADKNAINSTFEAIMTAVHEKEPKDKACTEDEYDCQDACIASFLVCNNRPNCRYSFDEDGCPERGAAMNIGSDHIVIILVVFSLIICGLAFALVFNCIRKLVRDHKIIKDHIRQSRENRLDEIGRPSTSHPLSGSSTDLDNRSVASSSIQGIPNNDLLPHSAIVTSEYLKELNHELETNYHEYNDIHQSNNVSNATQERLQVTHDMKDNSCQTRESLFDMAAFEKPCALRSGSIY